MRNCLSPRFVPALYLINSTLDLLISTSSILLISLALLTADSLQSANTPILTPAQKWSLLVLGFLQLSAYRVSVFTNTVLSVARTLKVLQPFRSNSLRGALASIGLYALYPCTLAVVSLMSLRGSRYDTVESYLVAPLLNEGSALLQLLGDGTANRELVEVMFSLVIPFCVPVCTCVVCAALMIAKLRDGSCPASASIDNQRKVTVTVLMLTVAFLVFNTAGFVKFLAVNICGLADNDEARLIILFIFPLLNAIANPVILFARSKDLRLKLLTSMKLLRDR